MRPQVQSAWEAFHTASEARRKDLHSREKADALVAARAAFEERLMEVLKRVPYFARKVQERRSGRGGGTVHLAVGEEISIEGWHRPRGQTICGAPPGRAATDRPVTCAACLRLLDRHVDGEADPPELPL